MLLKFFCRFRFKVVYKECQLGFLMQLHFYNQVIQILCELIKSYDNFGLILQHLLRIPCHLFVSLGIQIDESVIFSLRLPKKSLLLLILHKLLSTAQQNLFGLNRPSRSSSWETQNFCLWHIFEVISTVRSDLKWNTQSTYIVL